MLNIVWRPYGEAFNFHDVSHRKGTYMKIKYVYGGLFHHWSDSIFCSSGHFAMILVDFHGRFSSGRYLYFHRPTMSANALFSDCPPTAFVHLSGQISLPRYLLSNLDET